MKDAAMPPLEDGAIFFNGSMYKLGLYGKAFILLSGQWRLSNNQIEIKKAIAKEAKRPKVIEPEIKLLTPTSTGADAAGAPKLRKVQTRSQTFIDELLDLLGSSRPLTAKEIHQELDGRWSIAKIQCAIRQNDEILKGEKKRKCLVCDRMSYVWGKSDNAVRHHKSGVKGIYWAKRSGKWRVQITRNGKSVHIGHFDSVDAGLVAKNNYLDKLAYAQHIQ